MEMGLMKILFLILPLFSFANYILNETLKPETLIGEKVSCEKNPLVKIDKKEFIKTNQGYELILHLKNTSKNKAEVCLTRFSVIQSPLILIDIKNSKKESLLTRLPEVYVHAEDQVMYNKFSLPAHSTILIKQSITDSKLINHKSEKLHLHWKLILNSETKEGSFPIKLP